MAGFMPAIHDHQKANLCLARPCLLLRFARLAREALLPQLARTLARAFNRCMILRHRLRSVGFLLLARLEQALGANLLFLLGHAFITLRAAESSPVSSRMLLFRLMNCALYRFASK